MTAAPPLVPDGPPRVVEASLEELRSLQENTLPSNVNTCKTTRYAANLYNQWSDRKRAYGAPDTAPPLDTASAEDLAAAIPRFLLEIRTNKGKKYRGESVKVIYASLNRYLVERSGFNIFHDPRFRKCRESVDKLTRDLIRIHKPHKRSACAIPLHVEQSLWETGVLGPTTPRSLIDGLMWKVGTLFSVRGGLEYRNERKENVRFEVISRTCTRVVYTQPEEKVKLSGRERRVVTHVEDPTHPNSFTSLFNLYVSRLPKNCDLSSAFWFAPNANRGLNRTQDVWYGTTPIGLNSLATFVKRIMRPYGDCYTNHSLRATAIKSMINAGVSDRDIIRHTGLKSLATVAKYHRDEDNLSSISAALEAPSTGRPSEDPPSSEINTSTSSELTAKFEEEKMDTSTNAKQTTPVQPEYIPPECRPADFQPTITTQRITAQHATTTTQRATTAVQHPTTTTQHATTAQRATTAQHATTVSLQPALSYQMQPVHVHLVHHNPVLAQAMMLSRVTRAVLDSVADYKPPPCRRDAATNTDLILPARATVSYTLSDRLVSGEKEGFVKGGQYHRLGGQKVGEVAVNTRLSLGPEVVVSYSVSM